ncbi:MAG: DUF4139 domain-containing protein [Deltaproteobacteria bacterium]|nr:DUF4139 domain-containing protein [Deltaproteobacteria bacterium]
MNSGTLRMAGAFALVALLASGVRAQERRTLDVGGDARASANVTIYNNNLALVRETRSVELAQGVTALRWKDVAQQVRPETVHVGDPDSPGAFTVLEQNYKYDVLNPTRLMELYLNRELMLVTVNPATGAQEREQATLLSTQDYSYVYRTDEGITFGHPGRVVFPEVPANFVERPTLEWLLDCRQPGARTIEASYLTYGMSWNADYVLVLKDGDSRGDLTGWVTLHNDSGIGFEDASLQLVAGQVNVVQPYTGYDYGIYAYAQTAMPASAPAPQFAEEGMFEYHLYTLQRPTDLMNREQKQIELLGADGVKLEKKYRLDGDSYYYVSEYTGAMENLPVSVWIEFDNSEDNGMGIPLPAGTIRLYTADASGGQQFIGEDAIDHTPRDERVELQVGRAFDVVAERKQLDYEVLSSALYETEWEIRLRNRKPEAIVVEIHEPMAGDWQILESSQEWEKESAMSVLFTVPVRPDQEVVVTYRVRTRY